MTEFVNNNGGTNLVDNSNNCLHPKEIQRDLNKESKTRGEKTEAESCEEEEEHTIRIPFFSLEKYKMGLITSFDEIIGLFYSFIYYQKVQRLLKFNHCNFI